MAKRYLQRIADLLGQGALLSEALPRGFPHCSALSVSLITAGERTGQLPTAVSQLEQMLIDRTKQWGFQTPAWPYALCLGTTMFLLVSGIMVAVVPKFKAIFADFGAELPPMTRLLIDVSDTFLEFSVLLIPVLMMIPVGLYLRMRPRRSPDPAITSVLADWFRWWVPGLKQMEFSRGMNVSLKTMMFGVRAGIGLAPAAELASNVDVNVRLRPKFAQFAELLTNGTPARQAAMQADLGKVMSIALASGERGGDMARALDYAAEYYGAIGSRLAILARNLAWPAMTLAWSVAVAFIVLALFVPLIVLINSVTY
jgi:type II secretory pathway component PulF